MPRFRQDMTKQDKQAGWEHLKSQSKINAENNAIAAQLQQHTTFYSVAILKLCSLDGNLLFSDDYKEKRKNYNLTSGILEKLNARSEL